MAPSDNQNWEQLVQDYLETPDTELREKIVASAQIVASAVSKLKQSGGKASERSTQELTLVAKLGLAKALDHFANKRREGRQLAVDFQTYALAVIIGEVKRYATAMKGERTDASPEELVAGHYAKMRARLKDIQPP